MPIRLAAVLFWLDAGNFFEDFGKIHRIVDSHSLCNFISLFIRGPQQQFCLLYTGIENISAEVFPHLAFKEFAEIAGTQMYLRRQQIQRKVHAVILINVLLDLIDDAVDIIRRSADTQQRLPYYCPQFSLQFSRRFAVQGYVVLR